MWTDETFHEVTQFTYCSFFAVFLKRNGKISKTLALISHQFVRSTNFYFVERSGRTTHPSVHIETPQGEPEITKSIIVDEVEALLQTNTKNDKCVLGSWITAMLEVTVCDRTLCFQNWLHSFRRCTFNDGILCCIGKGKKKDSSQQEV